LNPLIATVRAIWELGGIQNRGTATETDIVAFEQQYGVRLAPIIRDYFCELNGTSQGELGMDDANLIGFWHLDQVRPMKEDCPQYVTADEPDLFMFADYSIWAIGYAVRLATADDAATAVFLIGGDKPLELAETFEEFLRRYSVGDQSVLFGPYEAAKS